MSTTGRTARILPLGIVAIACLCIAVGGLALVGKEYHQRHNGRIYPGVSVYGVDLGGLTVDEAAAALQSELPDPTALSLTLRDGERTWSRSWADLGLHLDPLATARLAYQTGREGSTIQRWGSQMQALLLGRSLSPIVVLPDPARAAAALQELAPELYVPPVNATLIIQLEGITPLPARAGQALDVEATIAMLPHTVGVSADGLVMDLLTRPVAPAIEESTAALAQVEALLAQPFVLLADDPLTDFKATWTVESVEVVKWLTTQPMGVENGSENGDQRDAWLQVTIREEGVRTYLESMSNPLADGIALNVEQTIAAIRAAIEAGRSQAPMALSHLPRTYVVQPGDTLVSVAHAHGFPVWRLTEVNPDINPGELRPGQRIVIPSLDVLFPLPLITDRRIVVDLSDQRLYTYEITPPHIGGSGGGEEALIHNFVCSTGIPSSPTIAGKFQVLSKQEEAYASNWDLWMPHFIGIYRAGPDFTNGIHALPTLSSGVRLWEGVLGSPASYGCIVLGLNEAAALYEWVELGTLVVIQE
ncbi:MAG: hypothetical protein DRI48_03245 [Chloroflexi bacterium]|nr:MAG: hypothetical protein DRI48_03245 [Chloroflexota bacterium]